jgi:hypothetical protein
MCLLFAFFFETDSWRPEIGPPTFAIAAYMDELNSMVSFAYENLEQQNVIFRTELVQNFENTFAVHEEIIYKYRHK